MQAETTQPSSPRPANTTICEPSEQADCPECRGTGWAVKSGQARLCRCSIERKVRAAMPERYWPAKLEDFHGPALEYTADWLASPSDGLFVTGPCGVGKTYLACAIVRHFVEAGCGVKLQRAGEFFAQVREMFKSEAVGAEAAVMYPLFKVRYLVLDDLGAGSLSDCERRYILELVDTRLNSMRPSVVTSNWSLAEISEKLDDRIASRLAGFAQLELTGKDRRVAQ